MSDGSLMNVESSDIFFDLSQITTGFNVRVVEMG